MGILCKREYNWINLFRYLHKKLLSTIKKLAGQTAIYGLSTILGRFLNYLLVPIQTRVFNLVQFGTITGLYAYITFLNVLLTHGMETTFFRFAEKHNHEQSIYSTALRSVLFFSLLFGCCTFLFASQIAELIHLGANAYYIKIVAAIISLDAISAIPFALLRKENKALRFALIKNAGIAITIFLNIYFLLIGPYWLQEKHIQLPFIEDSTDPSVILLANLCGSVLTCLLLIPEIIKIRFNRNRVLYQEMLEYAIPIMFIGFAGMINETLDRIMLVQLIPDQSIALRMNGIYGANYKLSIVITLFIQAFKYAAEPFFFKHGKGESKGKIYADVMHVFVIVCLSIFLMVMLNMRLFEQFIGEEFREGLSIVPVLLWANIFLGIYYNLSIWYKLTDQTSKGAYIAIAGALITIVLNYMLIPILGYYGAAISTAICYGTMMVLGYAMGQKYYPIPYRVIGFVVYAIIAIILWGIGSYIQKGLSQNIPYYLVGNGLLILFILIAFFKEKSTSHSHA